MSTLITKNPETVGQLVPPYRMHTFSAKSTENQLIVVDSKCGALVVDKSPVPRAYFTSCMQNCIPGLKFCEFCFYSTQQRFLSKL